MSEQMKNTVTTEEPKQCTAKEKIGHIIGVLGHDSAYNLWGMWATPFMTDILQLPAVVLGILALVGRIFDGINDIAMGFIADRTRSKHGRFRAWVLRAGPLFCLCMALSFFVPSENMTIKIIYASIMYVVVDLVFTAVDIPFWSLPSAMTKNTAERSNIIAGTTTASNAVSGLVSIVMPIVLGLFGGEQNRWAYFSVAFIVAVFAAVMYLISFFMVKEHVVPDPKEKFSFKLAIQNIFTNKPLLLIQISNMFCLLALVMKGTFNFYYCTYNLGSMELMSAFGLVSLVCTIVGSLVFMPVSKYAGKKNAMFILAGVYVAACLVLYFSGWTNLILVFVCYAFTSTCAGGAMVCINAMMADTIEYGEWRTGQRNEAMITSTRCFVTKLVMAVSGVAVAFVIGFSNYVPGAQQSAATLNAFHIMSSLVCAGVMIASVAPMFFYDLTEKRHAQIMAELAARKAQK